MKKFPPTLNGLLAFLRENQVEFALAGIALSMVGAVYIGASELTETWQKLAVFVVAWAAAFVITLWLGRRVR